MNINHIILMKIVLQKITGVSAELRFKVCPGYPAGQKRLYMLIMCSLVYKVWLVTP